MTTSEASTPVLIGAGQASITDDTQALSVPELIRTAARDALADTGTAAERVRDRIGLVGVADCMSWRPADPGRIVAGAIGAAPRETVATRVSGTSPLDLLADACQRIQSGAIDTALLTGAETFRALRAGLVDNRLDGEPAGGETGGAEGGGEPADPAGDAGPTRLLGSAAHANHPAEEAAGLGLPVHYYPLFENALRAAAGRERGEHERRVAALWARFAAVAAANPHAWDRSAPSAAQIAGPGDGNRMITYPYRKLTTANIQVNQSAAVVVCSAAAAEAAGVPRERWVYVHATAAANDHWYVGQRPELHRSPALRAIGAALLEHTGLSMDRIAHRDLYSCFPSAVQVAAAELGIDLDSSVDGTSLDGPEPGGASPAEPGPGGTGRGGAGRGGTAPGAIAPTVTGGLTFAGGPGSNYVTHALAGMLAELRADPGGTGLVTATGWYLTKHAAAILSARPPTSDYAHRDVQATVDLGPTREIAEGYTGPATVETYTISHDRTGEPTTAHLVCLTGDRRRAFAATSEPAALAQFAGSDPIGREVTLPGCAFADWPSTRWACPG